MSEADFRRTRAVAFGRSGLSRFVPQTTVLNADDVARALKRMAHEIIEANSGLDDVIIIGMERGGVPVARAIADALGSIEDRPIEFATIDVSFYRDDISTTSILPEVTNMTYSVSDKHVVLCDDVLFTGRTVRAALDAVTDFGRPKSIQLAVMVDRGHRELPIRPDFVGKNLPTARSESVKVSLDGVVIGTTEPVEQGTREDDS